MNPGKMNRLMAIKRNVQIGTSPLNEPIYELQTVHRVWAEKIHKSEDERFSASQTYATRVVTFRIWYLADLTESDTLMVDGDSYNIKGIRELGFRAGTEIAAEYVG